MVILPLRSRLDPAGLALAGFFFGLTALYMPVLLDAAVTPRWAWVSIGVPLLWAFAPPTRYLTFGHAAGIAFLGVAVLSLSWAPAPLGEGLDALWQLVLLAGLFVVGAGARSLRGAWIGAGLGMAINSGVVLAQWAGWHGLAANTSLDGLFFNRNWSAEAAAVVLVGCAAVRLWPLALAAAPPVLLSGARAAALAVAATAVPWLWRRSRVAVLALALAGGAAVSWLHLGDGGKARLALWADTAEALTPAGHGLGSFYLLYPAHAPRVDTTTTRPEHAHNDLLEVTYELGPLGLIALVALYVFACGSPRVERYPLGAVAVIACFSFPLHQPAVAALAALCCGHLCGDRPSLRYHLAVCRMALLGHRGLRYAAGRARARRSGSMVVSARGEIPGLTGLRVRRDAVGEFADAGPDRDRAGA